MLYTCLKDIDGSGTGKGILKEKSLMSVIKKYIDLLRNLIHKMRFCMKLKQMDDLWYFMGGSCFGLFSPSFYYTHTSCV